MPNNMPEIYLGIVTSIENPPDQSCQVAHIKFYYQGKVYEAELTLEYDHWTSEIPPYVHDYVIIHDVRRTRLSNNQAGWKIYRANPETPKEANLFGDEARNALNI